VNKEDTEWRKFRREFEAKLMPRWVQQKLNDVDTELEGERAKRETAEAHEKTLRAQISKEAKIQQNLKGERDRALTEIGELRGAVEERDKALQAHIAKQAEIEQGLKTERDRAFAEVLKAAINKLAQGKPDAGVHPKLNKRWIAIGIVGLGLIGLVSLSWSSFWKADDSAEAVQTADALAN